MEIKEAKFVISSSNAKGCPAPRIPEYAFIGRSNVGKSSLINMLCNNKSLAKTSATPGKTQLINHFLINQSWYLVDLPGYGYAKVSKARRSDFGQIITSYLENRENLMYLFVLVDSRLEPQEIDLRFMRLLTNMNIPFAIVFTKLDKLNKTEKEPKLAHYREVLQKEWIELPPLFQSSATKKTGKEEILEFIDQINQSWKAIQMDTTSPLKR